MRAFKLIIKHKWSPKEDDLLYVGEDMNSAKKFFADHWNSLTYLVDIQDITDTEKGMSLVVRNELEKRGDSNDHLRRGIE